MRRGRSDGRAVPEHVKTLHRDGFTKRAVRDFLFENTGIRSDILKMERAKGLLT